MKENDIIRLKSSYMLINRRKFVISFLSAFTIFIFINPDYMYKLNSYKTFVFSVRYLDFGLMLGIIVFWGLCKRKIFFSIPISLFLMLKVVSQVINNVQGIDVFEIIVAIVFFWFFETLIKTDFIATCKGIYWVLLIYVFINLLTVLIWPNGMYLSEVTHNACYFLGHKNSAVKFMIPFLFCAGILYESGELNKRVLYVEYILCIIVPLISRSSSALVSIIVIGICFLFFRKRSIKSSYILIASLIMFIGINILRLQYLFSFLIEEILDKDLTLTSRTIIWDFAMLTIAQRPIMGWGTGLNYEGLNSAHCLYFDILIEGGIVSLVLFMCILFISSKKIYKSKYHYIVNSIYAGYLVLALVEPIQATSLKLLFLILIISQGSVKHSIRR